MNNPRPNLLKDREPTTFNGYLYKRLPEVVNSPDGQRDAIAAPRGEAKSTKVSMSFVCWCLITGIKWYQTSTVNKLKASCTAGPKQAAERLAEKLYGQGDHIVKELTGKSAVHGVTQWHITAGAPTT